MTTKTASQVLSDAMRAALRRAFSLGQTYWQQADSEYTSQHRKADETQAKFDTLVAETVAAIVAELAAPAPTCATCNDHGMIGGPSFYSPDEGGEPCPTCSGTRIVPDGQITGEGGIEFSNGPIACVKDCPACTTPPSADHVRDEAVTWPQDVRHFLADVSQQEPEKPDYWSSCGQCERNIDRAGDLLDAAPTPPAVAADELIATMIDEWYFHTDVHVKEKLADYSRVLLIRSSPRMDAARPQQAASDAGKDGVRWDLFPSWLIDHCEGEVITEEGLQFALAEMLKNHPAAPTVVPAGEREAFEAWVWEEIPDEDNDPRKRGQCGYLEYHVDIAWCAWQALPRFSFHLVDGGVRRIPDEIGKWVEISAAAGLCESEQVDAILARATNDTGAGHG
jgi:hypothetical protein